MHALAYVKNFFGRYFYERTLFEADDQCQKHHLGLNYRSGWKKRGPLESGTDRKFSDLPNGLSASVAKGFPPVVRQGALPRKNVYGVSKFW